VTHQYPYNNLDLIANHQSINLTLKLFVYSSFIPASFDPSGPGG
jgi:hypothetical protein